MGKRTKKDERSVFSQKLGGNRRTLKGAKRPTAGDEPREFTSRGEGGRVPPFIEKVQGSFDFGVGGILKGLGSLLEKVKDLSEHSSGGEFRKEGEFGKGEEKGFKAVYGFSIKVGGEGIPSVERFGNVRDDDNGKGPIVDEVREPITDSFDEGEFLLVILEMPGINETDVKFTIEDDILMVECQTGDRKYEKEILLTAKIDREKNSHSYKNGILEIKLWKAKTQ